jgi:MFS family permease
MTAFATVSTAVEAMKLVGGVLTQSLSWRAVFWLNVPVGIAALLLVHVARPANVRRPDSTVNPFSLALLVAGVGLTVFAVQQADVWSWTSPVTLCPLGAGLVTSAVFVATQLRSRRPLVDLRLFARTGFTGDVTVVTLMQFGLLAVVLFSSLYLQQLLALSPMQSGLAVLPLILPITIGAQIAGRWYDRAGVRPPVLTGLATATLGLAAWTSALPFLSYAYQLPGMAVTGLGIGLIISPTNTDALGRVTPAERSQASGLVQTMRQLGGTLGVAGIGAVVAAAGHGGADVRHAADAITVGFAAATATFAAALVCGFRLLPRARVTDAPAPLVHA